MHCTSFIPAYNSAEGPREEDGGVTVEAEDWSSRAFSSISSFPVGNETFFMDVSASKTNCTTSQPSGGMLRRQPVFLKGILKAEMLVSLVCLH